MINGDEILAAVVSLREATEMGFQRVEMRFQRVEMGLQRVEMRVGAIETRLDRFEVKVLKRFDDLDARLVAVEGR